MADPHVLAYQLGDLVDLLVAEAQSRADGRRQARPYHLVAVEVNRTRLADLPADRLRHIVKKSGQFDHSRARPIPRKFLSEDGVHLLD
jgi:hypothetical protein